MLWYKAWLDTRWRFVIGLVLVAGSALTTVVGYPYVQKLLPQATAQFNDAGLLGRRIAEAAALAQYFEGYIWSQFYLQQLPQLWSILAALIGTGGLMSQAASGGGTLFTLSLPVTRGQLTKVRAAAGLAELFVLAMVPSLLIPVFAPLVGESYGVVPAVVHGVVMWLAGTIFFSLAFLLSTVFSDIWRPFLLVACVAVAEQAIRALTPYSLFRLMSAESYFRGTGLPWLGLLAATAVSASLLYLAGRNLARQDF